MSNKEALLQNQTLISIVKVLSEDYYVTCLVA